MEEVELKFTTAAEKTLLREFKRLEGRYSGRLRICPETGDAEHYAALSLLMKYPNEPVVIALWEVYGGRSRC
jgi:hypothetical protein